MHIINRFQVYVRKREVDNQLLPPKIQVWYGIFTHHMLTPGDIIVRFYPVHPLEMTKSKIV